MSAAIRNVKRFFRSIALFRRDGVADPQIADRSGDVLNLLLVRIEKQRLQWLDLQMKAIGEARWDTAGRMQIRIKQCDQIYGFVLQQIEAINTASVKDTDSDIA